MILHYIYGGFFFREIVMSVIYVHHSRNDEQ